MKTALLGAAALLLISTQVVADEQPSDLIPVPEPPPIPERLQSGEVMEPDITIIQRREETIVEYRLNGRLRAVKVVPRNESFPAYYLVDADGDGRLESRRSELTPQILVNSWVIFSWN